jgi:hypothetical protein
LGEQKFVFYLYKNYTTAGRFILKLDCNGTKLVSSDTIERQPSLYTTLYDRIVCRSYKNKIYYNIYSEYLDFNLMDTPDKCLDKCRHIQEIDMDKKKFGRLLAAGYDLLGIITGYTFMLGIL